MWVLLLVVVLVLLVTGVKQSQLLVLRLSLEFDNNISSQNNSISSKITRFNNLGHISLKKVGKIDKGGQQLQILTMLTQQGGQNLEKLDNNVLMLALVLTVLLT